MDEAEELDRLREVFPHALRELAAHQADGFTAAQVREYLEEHYSIPPRIASPQKVAAWLGREVRAGRLRVVTLAGETVNRYLLVTETTEGDMKRNDQKTGLGPGCESSNRLEISSGLPKDTGDSGGPEEAKPAEDKADARSSEEDLDHRIKQMIAYRGRIQQAGKAEAAIKEYGCDLSFYHASAQQEAKTNPQAFEDRYNNLKRAMEGFGLMSTVEKTKEALQLVRQAHFSVLQKILGGDKERAHTVKKMRFREIRKSPRELTDTLIEALRAEGVGVEKPRLSPRPSPLAGIVGPVRVAHEAASPTGEADEPPPVDGGENELTQEVRENTELDTASAEEQDLPTLEQEVAKARREIKTLLKIQGMHLQKIKELSQKGGPEEAAEARQGSEATLPSEVEAKLRYLEHACNLLAAEPSALPGEISKILKEKADLVQEIERVGAQPGQLAAHYTALNDEVVRLRREGAEFPARLEQAKEAAEATHIQGKPEERKNRVDDPKKNEKEDSKAASLASPVKVQRVLRAQEMLQEPQYTLSEQVLVGMTDQQLNDYLGDLEQARSRKVDLAEVQRLQEQIESPVFKRSGPELALMSPEELKKYRRELEAAVTEKKLKEEQAKVKDGVPTRATGQRTTLQTIRESPRWLMNVIGVLVLIVITTLATVAVMNSRSSLVDGENETVVEEADEDEESDVSAAEARFDEAFKK